MRSQSFAFLATGSSMQSNSQGTRQVKKSVEAGVERKDIKIAVRPVKICGLEMVLLHKEKR